MNIVSIVIDERHFSIEIKLEIEISRHESEHLITAEPPKRGARSGFFIKIRIFQQISAYKRGEFFNYPKIKSRSRIGTLDRGRS